MDETKSKWENKILTVCSKCRQKIRLPISYKPLQVTCPKCRNEFHYNYLTEFGNDGEYYAEVQTILIVYIVVYLSIILLVLVISIAIQNFFFVAICLLAGILFVPVFFDYKEFSKYRPIKILIINRQGLIYFDQEFMARESLNWSDITSMKYIYIRHMFGGLIETKREPACIELEIRGKGKVKVPPIIFFNDEQRTKIIDDILRHCGTSRMFFGT